MSASNSSSFRPASASLGAFLFGVPVGVGVLVFLTYGPWQDPLVQRYLSHPVEQVEVVAFCCGLGFLISKLMGRGRERAALTAEIIPAWDSKPVAPSQAEPLLAELKQQPDSTQGTYLGRRAGAILDFVASRNSADELDDQLRTLSDNDAMAQEGSYSLLRFITWAIPILGFLGTVLGITEAIAGVTPEILEKSLSTVTDGLALAFDTTALALFLTMILMFGSFVVERLEQGVLAEVDAYVDAHLAHRFERTGSSSGQLVEVLKENTDVLLQATQTLVERQALLWSRSLDKADQHWSEAAHRQQERLGAAIAGALETTLSRHQRQMVELDEKFLQRTRAVMESLGQIAATFARLQQGEAQVIHLQETMQQNLNALASSGTFEEAVQSLTAAIHLMTTRVGVGTGPAARPATKAA